MRNQKEVLELIERGKEQMQMAYDWKNFVKLILVFQCLEKLFMSSRRIANSKAVENSLVLLILDNLSLLIYLKIP